MKNFLNQIDSFFHYQRVKHWLLTVLLLGACVGIYELIRIGDHAADMLQSIKKQADSQVYTEDFKKFTDEKKEQINGQLGKFDSILDNLKDITGNTKTDLHDNLVSLNGTILQANGMIADLRSQTLPVINKGILIVNSGVSQFSEDLHKQQNRIGQLIDDNAPNVKRLTDAGAHAAEKIDCYVSDPKIEAFIDTALDKGQKILVKFDKAADKVVVMASDGTTITANAAGISADMKTMADDGAKKFHSVLNPPPAPWWKRYILYPVKDGAGLAFILVKTANGL